MEYIYFLDVNRISIEDFLRLEYVAALEASTMGWKLFLLYETNHMGRTAVSLN